MLYKKKKNGDLVVIYFYYLLKVVEYTTKSPFFSFYIASLSDPYSAQYFGTGSGAAISGTGMGSFRLNPAHISSIGLIYHSCDQ